MRTENTPKSPGDITRRLKAFIFMFTLSLILTLIEWTDNYGSGQVSRHWYLNVSPEHLVIEVTISLHG